jgi:hypothetical protein
VSQLVRLVKYDDATTHKVATPGAARPIKKSDEELQIVWGEVYAPDFPDSQNDYATRDTIRKMAYGFMQKGDMFAIDTGHSRKQSGACIVESFIARDDDPTFIPGSWVLGVRVPDEEWALVKSGELNGFSMDGFGVRVETVLEIEMPNRVTGECIKAEDGHTHMFWVKYDDEGNFVGGDTDEGPDGHRHKILRGTCTEVSNGHSHRFSFVEGMMNAQISN